MLSKMARPETSYEELKCFKIIALSDNQSCYTKTTKWQKTLINGRIITLDIINQYNEADAYIYTTQNMVKSIKQYNSVEPSIVVDDYDGNIEITQPYTKRSLFIDGIELKEDLLVRSGQFSKQEAGEIYRTALKWDLEYREKSSDSESNSDSDCNTEKLQKHKWRFCGEKNIVVGTFNIQA